MTKKFRKHITIRENKESVSFTPIPKRGDGPNIPKRNRRQHADFLEKQFREIWDKAESQDQVISSISKRDGAYLQFRGQKSYDLIVKSLEDIRQNVRLCNVQVKDGVQYATVFVPTKKKEFFLKKINKYKKTENSENVIASIEAIAQAMVRELWTDERKIPQKNKEACEVWLSVYKKNIAAEVVKDFFDLCKALKIEYYDNFVEFPERAVVSIMANMDTLKALLIHSSNITEFRKNITPSSFFVKDSDRSEQKEWCEDLLERTTFIDSNLSICLLDKGVNNGHPLINPVLNDSDMHTTFDDQIVQDWSKDGHGTAMAGIATYFNLQSALENNDSLEIKYKLESVRFVDDNNKNKIDLYADVTSQAISHAEIENPNNKRVIVMPVTAGFDLNANKKDKNRFRGDGKPSSWSAGIDSLALGNYGAEKSDGRLIIVSAGNTHLYEIEEVDNYKDAVALHSVEDPAQAWNALTVGAFTEITSVSEDPSLNLYKPLVEKGGYSPFNSSSLIWEHKWPLKPDIVLEGGNVGYNKDSLEQKYDSLDELSLLTTSKKYHLDSLFTTAHGTSSATAQAAHLAIRIMEAYPSFCPQTVRAIMVHSSSWTDAMIRQVFDNKEVDKLNKTDLRELLRIVGYGKPNLEKALYSLDNSVNLIVEDTIQPFKKDKNSVTINEMALHEIPWPSDVLIRLGNTPVKMKVTLSYFIDPSPGEIGWENKYRYPGCRLYFDVNNVNEDKESFLYRINQKARDELESKIDHSKTQNNSERWLLGQNNRNVGSIHSDIWEDTAINFAENRYIAIYPGGGWWKERTNLKKYNSKIKYSLIVSISTPDESIDLYTPIQNKVHISDISAVQTKIEY